MLRIRRAQPQDAAALCVLLHHSITQLCIADHHNDPQILAPWLANKTVDNLTGWISRPGQLYLVAEIEDMIAAVGAVSGTGTILLNYVAPDYQYRGAGKALMAGLENWLQSQGQLYSRLNSTRTAQRFYQKIGYQTDEAALAANAEDATLPMIKILA